MSAAAQLGREIAHAEHAHLVAVLLAEERHRAGLDRLVVLHDARAHVVVPADLAVDERLHLADLALGHRLVVREVEARLVGVDERALLLHVRPEHPAAARHA